MERTSSAQRSAVGNALAIVFLQPEITLSITRPTETG